MIDDRIQHRAAVGEPFERDQQARRQVGTAVWPAGPLDDVDGEERQIARNEDNKEDPEYLQTANI